MAERNEAIAKLLYKAGRIGPDDYGATAFGLFMQELMSDLADVLAAYDKMFDRNAFLRQAGYNDLVE